MTKQDFQSAYPAIADWIQKTLSDHAGKAKSVASLGFRRLPHYFDARMLACTRVASLPTVPVPPLSAMGLARFAGLEGLDLEGITYLDIYFVRADRARSESLHFHELVHVIQWRVLGPEKFLALYADGLERFGYRENPLEAMACSLQERFDREEQPFSVDATCRALIRTMLS